MTVLSTELFNGGTNGAAITISNTSSSNVSGAGPVTFTNSPAAPEGTLWMKAESVAQTSTVRFDHTASTTVYGAIVIRMETTDVITTLLQVYSSATLVLGIRQNTDNTIQLRDGTTTRWTSPALTVGTDYQFVWKVQPSTATTGCYLKIYDMSGTLIYQSGNQTLNVAAVTTTDRTLVGHLAGNPTTTTYFDRLIVDDAAEPSVLVSHTPVTANAGADQANKVAYSTVTLTGSGGGGDGTYTYSWSQLSGPTVTLTGTGAGRTFVVPASQTTSTLTFRLTVDDGLGFGDSIATDDVVVTTLPHNYYRRASGAWLGVNHKLRSSGSWV